MAYVFGVVGLSLVSADVSACLLAASFQSCSWGVLCFLCLPFIKAFWFGSDFRHILTVAVDVYIPLD